MSLSLIFTLVLVGVCLADDGDERRKAVEIYKCRPGDDSCRDYFELCAAKKKHQGLKQKYFVKRCLAKFCRADRKRQPKKHKQNASCLDIDAIEHPPKICDAICKCRQLDTEAERTACKRKARPSKPVIDYDKCKMQMTSYDDCCKVCDAELDVARKPKCKKYAKRRWCESHSATGMDDYAFYDYCGKKFKKMYPDAKPMKPMGYDKPDMDSDMDSGDKKPMYPDSDSSAPMDDKDDSKYGSGAPYQDTMYIKK